MGSVAAAELLLGAEHGSRAIIGAHSGEGRDGGKDRFAGFGLDAPNIGAKAQARLENDDRAPGATTLQIHLAAAADFDQPSKVSAYGSKGGRRVQRGDERNEEQEDPSAEGHGAADVEAHVVRAQGAAPTSRDSHLRRNS
jgi:hypothetical protein